MIRLHTIPAGPARILLFAAALWIGGVTPASSHLALIRQGAESRGSKEPGDSMGQAVAAGDFNGDGYDDLASAAPGENLDGQNLAGAVIVNWGTAFGITHEGALLLTPEWLGGVNEANGDFGLALAAGDFNADGQDDLAIGQPGYDQSGSVQDIGKVWIVTGHASAFGSTAILTRFQSDAGGSNEEGDQFGAALATGDFNADGYADLAVGTPGEDAGAGAVFQFLGSAFGPIIDGGWFKQSTLGGTDTAGDRFGAALAAGNLAGVGASEELAVGAPFKNSGILSDVGVVYVIRGSSTGLTASSPLTIYASVRDAVAAGARFGLGLACGRFWGGSYDGLAVGEPNRTVGGQSGAGRVLVARGGALGLDWTTSGLALDQSDVGEAVESGDNFGRTLAAGHFDIHSETYEDLFVAAPGEDAGVSDTGWIGVLYGGSAGPSGSAWAGFYQGTLNDAQTGGEALGFAITSGKFDASGHGTLAVGAPGDNAFTGMVHVIAPWRQAYNLSSQRSIVYDCEGNRVFSVKPFDEMKIASTTKIMTVLIACERSQLPVGNPLRVPLNTVYEVPAWVRLNVPGSRFEFRTAETITLEQLLYACLYPSGNDAAYAIADLLTGGGESWSGITTTCTEFVDEMNDRAAALGMANTHFTNPAGLDTGDPYSTADDMMRLSRSAMANPLFAEVASDGSFTWTRQWESSNGTPQSGAHTQNYGWLANLRGQVPDANGLKPGRTPGALGTACMSVAAPWGENAYAGQFGLVEGDPDYYTDARALLELGAGECNWEIPLGQIPEFTMYLPDLPTGTVHYTGGGQSIDLDGGAAQLEIYRQTGQGTTAARLEVEHSADSWFEGGETAIFGISPFEEHGEIVLRNSGEIAASIRVLRSVAGAALDLVLAPGEHAVIPPYVSATPLTGFTMSIENRTGDIASMPVALTITERYAFELESIGVGGAPQFSATLNHPPVGLTENLNIMVIGRDPNPGSTLYFSAREVGAPSSVGDGRPDAPGGGLPMLVTVEPNPFSATTRIAFDLPQSGRGELTLFDARGREVRRFARTAAQPGRWEVAWDGRDAQGGELPGGVYFYRLGLGAKNLAEGKIVRIR